MISKISYTVGGLLKEYSNITCEEGEEVNCYNGDWMPTDLDCPDEHVMANVKCVPCHEVEDSISGEVYEEVGYYNEADIVPPITSSSYRVPKEKKQRKYSHYSGAK